MEWFERIEHYGQRTRMPKCMAAGPDGQVFGIWVMGNNYQVPSGYYGGYPHGYLKRIGALFPEKRSVLHLFSGAVDVADMPGDTLDVNPACQPTFLGRAEDVGTLCDLSKYDLVLADPPYSQEDAVHYGTTMVNRTSVVRALASGMRPAAHLVWLDQVLPMYRKTDWAIEARIGMVKSTNHRFRVITIFRRTGSPPSTEDEKPEEAR